METNMPFQKGNTLGKANIGRRKEGSVKIDAEYHREWRKKNPNSFVKSQKKYRESSHGKVARREGWLKRNFGISVKEYEEMLVKQNYRCAICGKHQSEMGKVFDVDHDHSTGKVRGLLCNSCNLAIGLLKDSCDLLIKALTYLKEKSDG